MFIIIMEQFRFKSTRSKPIIEFEFGDIEVMSEYSGSDDQGYRDIFTHYGSYE